jgi:uncharacterized membrane protein SpoIIM required for sporulation
MACFLLALLGGVLLYDRYPLPLGAASVDQASLSENYQNFLSTVGQNRGEYVSFVLIQNSRVLFLAGLLSFFSFGVVGLILTTLPFGILSYSAAAFINGDLSLLIFAAALFPHGLVEIPAIMIAGAACLQLGAVVTAPPKDRTIGEVWLRQIADTLSVALGVVLPMLILAAVLEVYITPSVIEWALQNA